MHLCLKIQNYLHGRRIGLSEKKQELKINHADPITYFDHRPIYHKNGPPVTVCWFCDAGS